MKREQETTNQAWTYIVTGGECSEHGVYEIGPDCPKCVQEVLEWTA